MTPYRSRVAATVLVTLTLLTALLVSPASAVPIPQDPGGSSVVPFEFCLTPSTSETA